MSLVSSANNKADVLTHVPQRWLKALTDNLAGVCMAVADTNVADTIKSIHNSMGHPGVNHTLYFVKQAKAAVTRRQVQSVVSGCHECHSIDPAPIKWKKGNLDVDENWKRVAMDITHHNGQSYLSLIDCGPSRFALWRLLRFQTSASVVQQLEGVFFERGVPDELFTDNDTAFRSKLFTEFARQWSVCIRFRCAYIPSGNEIVERCHRTIKVIAARKGCSVAEAVYLYNLTPKDDCMTSSAPANKLYKYTVGIRGLDTGKENAAEVNNLYRAGDVV